jgi:hypothetical protein
VRAWFQFPLARTNQEKATDIIAAIARLAANGRKKTRDG